MCLRAAFQRAQFGRGIRAAERFSQAMKALSAASTKWSTVWRFYNFVLNFSILLIVFFSSFMSTINNERVRKIKIRDDFVSCLQMLLDAVTLL